jgi:hypothetical protein
MKALGIALAAAAIATAGFVTACFGPPGEEDEDTGNSSSNVEAVDPLEGAYIKQGGTKVYFVFKKGDADNTDDTFLGEIEVDGEAARASGKVTVGRDNLGTTLTLSPTGSAKTRDTGKTADADAGDGGAPQDTRPLAQQAFSGKMHYLKIGRTRRSSSSTRRTGRPRTTRRRRPGAGQRRTARRTSRTRASTAQAARPARARTPAPAAVGARKKSR